MSVTQEAADAATMRMIARKMASDESEPKLLQALEERVEALEQKLNGLQGRLFAVDERVDTLEARDLQKLSDKYALNPTPAQPALQILNSAQHHLRCHARGSQGDQLAKAKADLDALGEALARAAPPALSAEDETAVFPDREMATIAERLAPDYIVMPAQELERLRQHVTEIRRNLRQSASGIIPLDMALLAGKHAAELAQILNIDQEGET